MCPLEPVEPYNFPVPPRESLAEDAFTTPVERGKPFKVAHISDVHIDRYYVVCISYASSKQMNWF